MQNDNKRYRQSLKDVALYAKRQAENVAWFQMIRDGTDEVEVADADFVIKGNAFAELSFLLGNAELNALAYRQVDADAGGKTIISSGIAVGFLCPELIVEDGVQVQAAGKWLDVDNLAQRLVPWNVVLFYGKGGFALV